MGVRGQTSRLAQSPGSLGSYFNARNAEGQVLLLFLPSQTSFPNDGIKYQDQETRFAIPVGSNRVSAYYNTLPSE